MDIEYTNFSNSMALQNLPKIGIFGLKMYHLATLVYCIVSNDQDDQIDRIFAQRVIVYFGQLLETNEVAHILGKLYSSVEFMHCGNEWVGLHFGRFFHKLIWSPCQRLKIGWSFSRNTFDESHSFVESVTSLYHFSL
jgi:hypothetical protein